VYPLANIGPIGLKELFFVVCLAAVLILGPAFLRWVLQNRVRED